MEHAVDRAEALAGLRHDLSHLRQIRDVGRGGHYLGAGGFDLDEPAQLAPRTFAHSWRGEQGRPLMAFRQFLASDEDQPRLS